MTFQIGALFALLAVMVYLFLTEKLAVDLTAFLGLIVLIFAGYVTPAEAFQGFSSPAVITMLSVFIVGAALLETGVADTIGGHIHRLVGNSEIRLVVTLMLVAGILSAFMNNIAATAVLMPAVATLGPRVGLAPSRLFMPLAFGAILGGTTTLVGTPPNILAAQILADRGLEPFKLFDFAPVGLAILALGVIYMLTIGRKLLPTHEQRGGTGGRPQDLRHVYQLEDRLFFMRLPDDSPLHGKTLAETRLGNALGVKVISILRAGKRIEPKGDTELRRGDLLYVDGEASRVHELLKLQGVEVQAVPFGDLPGVMSGVGGLRATVAAQSPVIGQSLRQLDFRGRHGLVVVGLRRGGILHRQQLGERTLAGGDELLALGTRKELKRFATQQGFEVNDIGLTAVDELEDNLYVILVPQDSALKGLTIAESRLGELAGLTVAGIARDEGTRLAVAPDTVIEGGDRLLLAANPDGIVALLEMGEVELAPQNTKAALETEKLVMVEATVAPRSAADGHTLAEIQFRDRHRLIALALWREGRPIHADLADTPLRAGDALLLYGTPERIRRLAGESDFIVLSESEQAPRRKSKAKYAVGALLLMIGLVASGAQPIHVAAFTAASLAILFGALTMREAYVAIEWRAIFLVAAVLPVGFAMERTGAANFLADNVTSLAGPLGPYAVLAALVVLSSMLSQGLDGAPAVVLMAPVVLEMAEQLGYSPYPLMMGVSLAASAAFMTPFSHKANLLVMGAGGYRSADYVRVGTPLTILLFVLMVFMIPIFFPF